MGLVIPGLIPSTLHEIVEYTPSPTEWKITVGIWAFGIMVLTVLTKLIAAVDSHPLRATTPPDAMPTRGTAT